MSYFCTIQKHNNAPNPTAPFSALFISTHEESEVEEAEDVFGARGAAVGHHGEDEDGEVEVPMRSRGLVAVRGSSSSRGHRTTERE